MYIYKRIVFTFLLLAVRNVICEEASLVLTPTGDQNAVVGKAFGIMCQGRQTDEEGTFTQMEWLNERGERIPEGSTGIKFYGDKRIRLSFMSPTTEDSGRYTCRALYSETKTLEAHVTITFFEEVSFQECPPVQNLVVGREECIVCKLKANSNTIIEWQKNKQRLNGNRFDALRGCLEITEVSEEDRGFYTIEAFDQFSGRTKYRNITVNILIPPKIVELPEKFIAIEEEQYVITCRAEGTEPLTYTWLNPDLADLSQMQEYVVDEGELTIKKVRREDAGTYTCKVTNLAGPDYETKGHVQLVVQIRPTIEQFNNITANNGTGAKMECMAKGNPLPEIHIRKEGSSFFKNDDVETRVQVQTRIAGDMKILTLTFRYVIRSDDGLYYCDAFNDAADVTKTGHLTINFKPDMNAMSLEERKVIKVWSGKPANLTCYAEAIPNATLSWKFNEMPISNTDTRFRIQGNVTYSNLIISIDNHQEEFLGTYTCFAGNTLGNDSRKIVLELATAPGTMDQIAYDKTTPTSITFILNGPGETGGLEILYYTIRYKRIDIQDQVELSQKWNRGGPDSRYTLGNLVPQATYSFTITASNEAGEGMRSKSREIVMPQETTPEPPEIIADKHQEIKFSKYADRFDIRWIIPEDGGKPIEAFNLRCFKVERTPQGNWQQVEKAIVEINIENWEQTPEYSLTGLQPDTTYRVEVRAKNSLGYSQPELLYFKTKAGEVNNSHTRLLEDNVISLPGIIAIVVVALLVTLVILDITCFFRFHCGLLYLMRYRTCGRSPEKVQSSLEDGRACVKEVSTANNGKLKTELKTPSPDQLPPPDKLNYGEKQSEMDNPAFDTKEIRPSDLIIDENFKNKSPNGSKTSIGKSSPV